jgi:hypothetical protein
VKDQREQFALPLRERARLSITRDRQSSGSVKLIPECYSHLARYPHMTALQEPERDLDQWMAGAGDDGTA